MVKLYAKVSAGCAATAGTALWAVLLLFAAAGCSPHVLEVRPTLYEIDLNLDPAAHTLSGKTIVHLARQRPDAKPPARSTIDLELHPGLSVSRVELDGADLLEHLIVKKLGHSHPDVLPTTHRLLVTGPADEIVVTLEYAGAVHQDVSSGEKEGEIHNFLMSAHVGADGVFLSDDGHWYPAPDMPDDADPALSLADFRLAVDAIPGIELVAGLERQPSSGDGRWHWTSALPQPGITLIGGPLRRWTRQHGDVTLHAVLDPDKGAVAEDILDLTADLLDRYQPLLGPYPYREFTVLEAFFSSGFAFPGCTQIAGNRLSVFKPYRNHGYIDHEMIHSWWGCGVYVDPRGGNWCESLTSYCANYYGYVLDGDEKGARKARRNQSNFLSSIKSEDDKPLSTYGQDDGAGRGVAYQKGAAVLHMLERKIGVEAMFAALRRLTGRHLGSFISWDQIQEAFEAEAGTDLDGFFDQWLRQGGAPLLELTGADWSPGSDRLALWVSQGDTGFTLEVPLRLHYGERTEDTVATVAEASQQVWVPCEQQGLTAVELDPDYHLFRKLKPGEVMPTAALTRRAKALTIIVPEGELADGYRTAINSHQRAVLGDDDDPKEGAEAHTVEAASLTTEELAASDLLIIGDAVRAPLVQDLLDRTPCPVSWTDLGFEIEGEAYTEPKQAVFFTVHHPDKPGSGITVYYGNSPDALANARVLSYYPNSLLVFNTPPGGETMDSHGMTHTDVLRRIDFESHDRIDF